MPFLPLVLFAAVVMAWPGDSSCSSVTDTDDLLANDPEELQRMQLALEEMERRLQGLQVQREQIAQLNADLDDVNREFSEKTKEMHSRLDEFEKKIPKSQLEQQMQQFLEMELLPTTSVSCENLAPKDRGSLEETLSTSSNMACLACQENDISPKTALEPNSFVISTITDRTMRFHDPTPKTGMAPAANGLESFMDRLDEISRRTEEFSNASRNHSTVEPAKKKRHVSCTCCGGQF